MTEIFRLKAVRSNKINKRNRLRRELRKIEKEIVELDEEIGKAEGIEE